MTKTIIVTALRLTLSLATAGPAQVLPAQSSSIDCAWGGEPGQCEALTMALVRKHATAHPPKAERAAMPPAPTHRPDRDEDPLASLHFE